MSEEPTPEAHIDNAIEQLEEAIEKSDNETLVGAIEEKVDGLHTDAMLASGVEYVGEK